MSNINKNNMTNSKAFGNNKKADKWVRPKVRNNVFKNEDGSKENWYIKKKDSKKREKWRANFKPHVGREEFEPQARIEHWDHMTYVEQFSEITWRIREIATTINVEVSDSLIRKIEGIMALFINLRSCKSYDHLTSAIFLYVRDFYKDKSVTGQVIEYIGGLFKSTELEQQDGTEDPSWLELLRNVQSNWNLVKGNKVFRQFSKLLCVLVTLGLCDVASIPFNIKGFKLFDEKMIKQHMTAYDLAEALFGTITYFAEGAYLCFKTGSLKPLMMDDFAALELDDEYSDVITMWTLVQNGNLEKFLGIPEQEFLDKLERLLLKLSHLLPSLSGIDKKLVSDKILKLKTIKNEHTNMKMAAGIRKAPFAVELFGDSSQGKTTFGEQLIESLLTSVGHSTDREFWATINAGDQYMSSWKTTKTVAILDDMANEKSEFVQRPPTRMIIDMCNNQTYYANKAELEGKGQCWVEPEIVLVTTNVKDLDARSYSQCPYSIQRRMDLVMTVKCKEKFQRFKEGVPCGVDSSKIREHYTHDGVYEPPLIDDIWEITIEQAVRPPALRTAAGYLPITWRGKVMENVSAIEAIQCAIEYFHEHRKNQQALLDRKADKQTLQRCQHPGCCHLKHFCPDHLSEQYGFEAWQHFRQAKKHVRDVVNETQARFNATLAQMPTAELYKRTNQFLDKWDWICFLPLKWLQNDRFITFLQFVYRKDIDEVTYKCRWYYVLFCIFALLVSPVHGILLSVLGLTIGEYLSKMAIRKLMMAELCHRTDNLVEIVRSRRASYAKVLCCGCASMAAMYAIAKVFKSWRGIVKEHGALEPRSMEDIKARDEQVNVWSQVTKRVLPASESSKCTTIERLQNAVENNLLYASVEAENTDDILMANVLMITSNMLLIPNHYFKKSDTLRLTCRKVNAEAVGGSFVTRICKDSSVHIEGTDFRLCYSSTGGSYRNLLKFFPLGEIVSHPFKMLWRQRTGELITAHGMCKAGRVSNGTCNFDGGAYYNLSMNTFGGLCGATLLSETRTPMITGLHLGGKDGQPVGCMGTLTHKQLLDAILQIKSIDGVLQTGDGEHFTQEVLGVNVTTQDGLHEKSPINFLPEGSQFSYYGSCSGAVTSRSDVRRTPISHIVTEVTGVENIWGAPKMKPEWYGWQMALANASKPGEPFPHKLLSIAIKDYKAPLIELVHALKWKVKPLTDMENVNGIPGCRFVDAINFNTSIGYPLKGPKSRYVIDLEPTKEGYPQRMFTQEIMDDIERVLGFYKRGQRAYTIAKACKKDEALPVAKGKCRIFYGNPIALTFLVRKYYLPVVRFLQMNPLMSECAVGINCHGPEWDDFYNHVMTFGDERLFGGDYSKYDQKLPSQLLIASLRILIDLAEVMGYDQEDRDIMSAMAGDIVYSLVAFNGDLVGLQSGTHISGNSLTVILNGICGSLNLRAYFYTQYASDIKFRDAAKIMTYGDDNIGSVSEKYPKFNIKGCSEFLEGYGQKYTMPDKDSELSAYLKPENFEFLKRFSVWHADLGAHVGALLDSSIMKSLHCYLRPKNAPLTPKEACATNIDGALREWFNHGEDVYEMRRKQMREVAAMAGITHMCTMLDETYNDRVLNWRETYIGEV